MKITPEEREILKNTVLVLKLKGDSYSQIAKKIGHSKSFARKLHIEAKAEDVKEEAVMDKYGFWFLLAIGLAVGIASTYIG